MFKFKRGFSAVVATALLLVIAVVALVSFQGWLSTYSSSVYVDIEQRDEHVSNLNIENIISGNTLYIKNPKESSVEILNVKADGRDCFVSGNYSETINTIFLGNCTRIGENELTIVTNEGIISKSIYVKDEYNNPCPKGYVLVPGNSDLGTSNFCVMKYEAREDASGNPVSKPSDTPWVEISQIDARAKCKDLGENYHLITDRQWVTIARNIENNPSNWNSSVVGEGFVYVGHSDNYPSSILPVTNTSDFYDGTLDSGDGTCDGRRNNWGTEVPYACSGQKRVLELSNGELIWDISGNVFEWTNDSLVEPHSGLDLVVDSASWDFDWSALRGGDYVHLGPSNLDYDYLNGMGKLGPDDNGADPSGTVHALLRGGSRWGGYYVGIFTLTLFDAPEREGPLFGFRCVYEP
jgi:formylglycine-generating enzyme required for sulfatase activity